MPHPRTIHVPDVKVHHTQGCGLCGSTDPHTHTHDDWRAFIDTRGPVDMPPKRTTPRCSCGQPVVDSGLCMDCIDPPNDVCGRCGFRHMEGGYCPTREQIDEYRKEHMRAVPAPPKRTTPPTNKRPDLSHLRRGRWYDEKPITATNTGSTGGNMPSIEEVRAGIAAANEKVNEGLGAVQQAHASLEEAQGQLMQATEGSGQADVSEANGLLAQAVNDLDTVRQQILATLSLNEAVGNRL